MDDATNGEMTTNAAADDAETETTNIMSPTQDLAEFEVEGGGSAPTFSAKREISSSMAYLSTK